MGHDPGGQVYINKVPWTGEESNLRLVDIHNSTLQSSLI